MSETPKKLVINVEKGTQEYVDLTPAEIAERDQMQAQAAEDALKREQEQAAIQAAKESAQAKLASLGLTPEEIQALNKN